MSLARKKKVSVTLSADLLAEIDAFAERAGTLNRSQVIESWLRRAVRDEHARQLERDTVEYYRGLTAAESEEDADWATAASEELGRLGVD